MKEFSFRNVSKSANVKVSAQLPIKLDGRVLYVRVGCQIIVFTRTADAIDISYNAARTIIACSLSKIVILNRHENSLLYTCAVYEIGTARDGVPTLSRKYDLTHNRQIESGIVALILKRITSGETKFRLVDL